MNQGLGAFLPIILLFVIFYFLLILPQRKRDKKMKAMLAALEVGDEIVSIGGIFGKIIAIKDDVLTIEVGADKTKMKIAKWAVRDTLNKKDKDTKTIKTSNKPVNDKEEETDNK